MNKLGTLLAASLVSILTANAQQDFGNFPYHFKDTLNEVVVTGTNNATKSNLLPYSVSTVGHKQIEATGSTQLLSALTGRIPSLFVTQRNILGFGISTGGSGGIKLRGVGGSPTSQVLMMVDGKPQFAGVFSHHIADNYESEYVDHVEIVRGPSSVLYGSNAMGGAINVITKTPKENGVNTTIQTQYGSYNTTQTAATNMTRFGGFSSVVSLGYDQTDGTQKNFDFKQYSGYVKLGYDICDNWNIYGDYSIMKFKGNDPIYAKVMKGTDDIYHQDVLRGEASLVVGNSYAKTNGAARFYFSHGDHKIEDPKPFQMLDNRLGILAYQNLQPWKDGNLTLGFDFDRYTGEIPLSGGVTHEEAQKKGLPTTMGREEIVEYSPYFTISQSIIHEFLTFNAGLRMANSNKFGTNWIPQAGFAMNLGFGGTIKANISKGYRNPSFKELYLYKMANPDLEPENMWNYEVNISKNFDNLFIVEFTGFISKGDNIIQTLNMKNVNTGEFCNKGWEFATRIYPTKNLSVRATYSYLYTDLNNLTGAPKHQYSIAADWTVIPQLIINADVTGVSRLYVADDVAKQNYALLNLRATYKATMFLDVFAQGNNLTNAKYCIIKGYEMPGATVTGGVKFRF